MIKTAPGKLRAVHHANDSTDLDEHPEVFDLGHHTR
jgi:hypothetical protein